uniref:Uncharacterized protein n=1 Tax=Cannabis sativa TaxID=3483 RepID=A0A803QCX6_CANSA
MPKPLVPLRGLDSLSLLVNLSPRRGYSCLLSENDQLTLVYPLSWINDWNSHPLMETPILDEILNPVFQIITFICRVLDITMVLHLNALVNRIIVAVFPSPNVRTVYISTDPLYCMNLPWELIGWLGPGTLFSLSLSWGWSATFLLFSGSLFVGLPRGEGFCWGGYLELVSMQELLAFNVETSSYLLTSFGCLQVFTEAVLLRDLAREIRVWENPYPLGFKGVNYVHYEVERHLLDRSGSTLLGWCDFASGLNCYPDWAQLLAVVVPIVGIGAFLWWAGRDIVQDTCPNCGNEFQIFKSTMQSDLQFCPFCTQPFSIVDNKFVRDSVKFSNQSTTFGEAFSDFTRSRKEKKYSSKAVVDVEAEIKDAD